MTPTIITSLILAAAAVISGIYATIRGVIRFAQYLTKSEEALSRTAQSSQDMRDDLVRYIKANDERILRVEVALGEHGKEIAVLHDRTLNRLQGRPQRESA